MTMRNGIKATMQAGFENTHIEGDNKILIQAVKGQIQALWEIQTLLQDKKTCVQDCNRVTITHIFR